MSNFFKIYYATPNKNETGYVSTQVGISNKQDDYNYTSPNSYRNTSFFLKKIEHDVEFPIFTLLKGAKLTDLMCCEGTNSDILIISQKFLFLLKSFNIDDYQSFNIKIRTLNGIQDYYFFYMYAQDKESEYINWNDTVFRLKPYLGEYENEHLLKFENYESFYDEDMKLFNTPKQSKVIKVSKLKLKTEIINKDMFSFGVLSSGFFISEKLRREIEKQGITGIRFRDADGLREPSYSPEMD